MPRWRWKTWPFRPEIDWKGCAEIGKVGTAFA
jgi:hypothetical protein